MKRKILTAVIGLAAIVFIYFLQTGSSSSYDPKYVPEDFKYEVSAEEAAAAVVEKARLAVEVAGKGFGPEEREVFYRVLSIISGNLHKLCRDGLTKA